MKRAGFQWDGKLQAWHMPSAAALRFLRALSITDATPEAVYEGLEACAGDSMTRGDVSETGPTSSGGSADPFSSSRGEAPMGIENAGRGAKIDWGESTVKISDESVVVEGAGRQQRECLRR